jgi:hypothetical protein
LDFTDHAVCKRTPAAKGGDQEQKGLQCGLFGTSVEKPEMFVAVFPDFRRRMPRRMEGPRRSRRTLCGGDASSLADRDMKKMPYAAGSLGVPVLSFDFGPLVELEGTVQVPLLDAGALLEAARSLLDGSAERERVAQAQTAFLNHRLDPRQSADAYEHIYRQTLNLD